MLLRTGILRRVLIASTRRHFLQRAALAAAAAAASTALPGETQPANPAQSTTPPPAKFPPPKNPVLITRETGDDTIARAHAMLREGADTLDAVHLVCLGRENDPTDHTVGLGGLPNEEGVVELDSCCMHGPTRRAGSVGAVHNIKNVCLVARRVMEHTGHVMIVGEGAERFAVQQGFKREDLMTDDSRRMWLLWKENNSDQDWWGPGISDPHWKEPREWDPETSRPKSERLSPHLPRHPGPEFAALIEHRATRLYGRAADLGLAPAMRWQAVEQVLFPTTGTIHVSAVNTKGEMSGSTTTSGLAWKIPGRLGDSPIIGAGCYTDQDVGSAGATGSGEENIKIAGAHTVVELMRQGLPPRQAGLETMRRLARNYDNDMRKLRYLDLQLYILRRDGAYAGVSLWSTTSTGKPRSFVVHDGAQRSEPFVSLYEGTPITWPPAKYR